MLQDEDIYTFFEPELPPDCLSPSRKHTSERRPSPKLHLGIGRSSSCSKRSSPEKNTSWNVLDLKKENYFSCAVGRTRTRARYLLNSSDDVVAFLKEMAEASFSSSSSWVCDASLDMLKFFWPLASSSGVLLRPFYVQNFVANNSQNEPLKLGFV